MKSKGFASLAVVLVVLLAGALGMAAGAKPSGSGSKWYAPRTWGTHKPADKVDKAAVVEATAKATEDAAKDKAIHAAAIEADKTVKAAAELPPSPAAEVVKRTAGNASALLEQVSPLTANEATANTALILGLLSQEITKRHEAEGKQSDAEKALALTSTELVKAQAAHDQATSKLQKAENGLRVAFEQENALANELRAKSARFWIALILAAILLLALIYARFCLGSVGVVLHGAQSYVPKEAYEKMVTTLDGEIAKVGQWAIRTGKQAKEKAVAKAKAVLATHSTP
jgi:hypothetical protein